MPVNSLHREEKKNDLQNLDVKGFKQASFCFDTWLKVGHDEIVENGLNRLMSKVEEIELGLSGWVFELDVGYTS